MNAKDKKVLRILRDAGEPMDIVSIRIALGNSISKGELYPILNRLAERNLIISYQWGKALRTWKSLNSIEIARLKLGNGRE